MKGFVIHSEFLEKSVTPKFLSCAFFFFLREMNIFKKNPSLTKMWATDWKWWECNKPMAKKVSQSTFYTNSEIIDQ